MRGPRGAGGALPPRPPVLANTGGGGPSLERLKALLAQQLQQSGPEPFAQFAPAGRESARL